LDKDKFLPKEINMISRYCPSFLVFFIGFAMLISCKEKKNEALAILPGAERLEKYEDRLRGKNVGVVANHTSLIGNTHLVDSLLGLGVDIQKIFCPEHGFRGKADAGETFGDDIDSRTGLPVISLYGRNKKPERDDLQGLDIMVFDLQDVGVRFYTYLSTMHYVMEACAESGLPLLVLDRPNPNGFYMDGPVLEKEHTSFVGMHPIPIVHGMTLGELARMINGEGWLGAGDTCQLQVLACQHYSRDARYILPVRPSPNLRDARAIYLYPTLGLFEGTVFSVGRGTPFPFQVIGHPGYPDTSFSFVPEPSPGARYPKLEGATCYGMDFRDLPLDTLANWQRVNLELILEGYRAFPEKEKFFIPFFEKLAGTSSLRQHIQSGLSASEIRASWQPALGAFQEKREKYLMY
jgi:uncharacterized protein YbbC (DUF1343 family)